MRQGVKFLQEVVQLFQPSLYVKTKKHFFVFSPNSLLSNLFNIINKVREISKKLNEKKPFKHSKHVKAGT